MEIYFAIDDKMLTKFGASQYDSKSFNWNLGTNSCIGTIFSDNFGDLFKEILNQREIVFPNLGKDVLYLCKAEIKNEDCIDSIRVAMVGDHFNDINVRIIESFAIHIGLHM